MGPIEVQFHHCISGASSPATKMQVGGDHYRRCAVQPFDLQKAMESSGNAFVDGARCTIIKYAFRKKGDLAKMAEDLRKAAHYATEAASLLESNAQT